MTHKHSRKPVRPKRGQFESLVGRKFNKLLVVSYVGRLASRNTTWNCLCDCGKTTVAAGSLLKNGHVKSCGCLKRGQHSLRHGHSARGIISMEYRAWQGMRTRCSNPNEDAYPRYGGRGIKVCERWNASFEAFLADIGPKPSAKHSLGRVDNDGNYEPGNVRWETPFQQGGNNSRNRNFTIDGRTMCLAAWVRERGMVLNTVHRRLKRGQGIEQALDMAAVDQNEVDRVRDRTIDGMAERARQGVKFGAPPKVSPDDAAKMKHMRFKTGVPVNAIAQRFKVSPAAVYQHTK